MSIKNITYLDLIEACEKPGCLVCTLTQEMVEGYIRMLFHEHINDPPSRDKLRYSYGLCYRHSWLAIDGQLGNALGVAIISHDVIGKLLQDLSDLKVEEDRFGLQSIRERVRLFDGSITIESAPAEGTRISVRIPLLASDSD